jgi:hypothetical protein
MDVAETLLAAFRVPWSRKAAGIDPHWAVSLIVTQNPVLRFLRLAGIGGEIGGGMERSAHG